MKKVKARKDYVLGFSNRGVERALRSNPKITVYQGHARFTSPQSVAVGGEALSAPRIFINVGGRRLCRTSPASSRSNISRTARCWTSIPAAAPNHRRRQLHRARVRPNLPPLRQRGDSDRDGAASDPARGRGRVRRRRRHPEARRHRPPPGRQRPQASPSAATTSSRASIPRSARR